MNICYFLRYNFLLFFVHRCNFQCNRLVHQLQTLVFHFRKSTMLQCCKITTNQRPIVLIVLGKTGTLCFANSLNWTTWKIHGSCRLNAILSAKIFWVISWITLGIWKNHNVNKFITSCIAHWWALRTAPPTVRRTEMRIIIILLIHKNLYTYVSNTRFPRQATFLFPLFFMIMVIFFFIPFRCAHASAKGSSIFSLYYFLLLRVASIFSNHLLDL